MYLDPHLPQPKVARVGIAGAMTTIAMKKAILKLICGLVIIGVPSISLAFYKEYSGEVPDKDKEKVEKRIREDCTILKEARGFWSGGDINENWSLGNDVSTQLMRYNFTKGKASLNTQGFGFGFTARYYRDDWMADVDGDGKKDIRRIKPECRATSFSAKTLSEDLKAGKIAFPFFSVSPTLFVAKPEDKDNLSIQPALVIGIFRDIVKFGVGFNATKPDRGNVFMLLGFGVGFNF